MAAAAGPVPDPGEGFVRLVATMPLHSDPERVASLLRHDAAKWLAGAAERPSVGGLRRFVIDLRLRIGGRAAGLTTLSKAAYLDVGVPQRTATGWVSEISWRASTIAPLFPVFSGWLSIGPEELRIEGIYAPPGGAVGLVADRILLHTAANGTARWLLGQLDAAALGAAT
jgi:hypothetical protein